MDFHNIENKKLIFHNVKIVVAVATAPVPSNLPFFD